LITSPFDFKKIVSEIETVSESEVPHDGSLLSFPFSFSANSICAVRFFIRGNFCLSASADIAAAAEINRKFIGANKVSADFTF